MENKSEINLKAEPLINLKLIPEQGETFIFKSSEISKFKEFERISVPHEANSIQIKVLPIGATHFELFTSIHLKRPMSCSRCGEDFQNWFKEEAKEYLSLDFNEEGEGQGFLLIDSPKWNWVSFIIESVELEAPYQAYKYGENCLKACPHYDEALKKGWISKKRKNQTPSSPFQALEKLKNKLN